MPRGYVPEDPVLVRVCSWDCFDSWAAIVLRDSGPPVWDGDHWTSGGLYLKSEAAARALDRATK